MLSKNSLVRILILLTLFFNFEIYANGPTAGVIKNTYQAFEGYTLFAPMDSGITYLIDNYGRIVNTWESQYEPNLSVYLLENGNLLRPFLTDEDICGVQIMNWEGDLIWDFIYTDTFYLNHHDVEPLPNGNILLLVRDIRLRAELEDAGRDPASISTARIWLEKIVEIEPTGFDTGSIVWEWRVYDHLVQDFDSLKNNYGVVEEHPELIDVNFTPTTLREWLHANGLDYNSDLDQIIISVRNLKEFWIIDHSTTTIEASGHTGGNSGKGGDVLYRWGNPQTYRAVVNDEQKLFSQHDARWIENGFPNEGNITIFNNGVARPKSEYSTVEEIITPVDTNGNYTMPILGNSFEPIEQTWIYGEVLPWGFYSSNISGAHRLQNGNTMICVGADAHFLEVQSDKTTAWEYLYPTLTTASIFRCHKYSLDYFAFEGRDITPRGYLELNPIIVESTQHSPVKPTELDEVVITSKIYDTSGINSVSLYSYFGNDSLQVPMNDDGTGYDQIPNDSIYTASISALQGVEKVNYYIKITDNLLDTFNDPPFASQDYTFYYDLISTTPVNISISRDSDTTLIEWDAIQGVSHYKVYSSNNPYSGFDEDLTGVFNGESWSTTTVDTKKFYYVKALSSK